MIWTNETCPEPRSAGDDSSHRFVEIPRLPRTATDGPGAVDFVCGCGRIISYSPDEKGSKNV